MDKLSHAIAKATDPGEIDALMSREVYESVGDRFIHGLMQLGDRDLAEERAKKIDVSGISYEPTQQLAVKDAADFYQLIDKDLGITRISSKDASGKDIRRAHANLQDDSIGMAAFDSKRNQRRVLFHEMAHFSEFRDAESGKVTEDWVKNRARGAETPLAELTGNPSYQDDERAYPDRFISPYVGKLYGNGITEVHSMGLQHFANGRAIVKLFKEDREHFDLMIRYIRR